jgi:hypothetical protein
MKDASAGIWAAGAFAAAVALAVGVIVRRGADGDGIVMALRLTARWSYLWFWPAYAGGALAALFSPLFRPVAQRARVFGLAFAAALMVHAGLVAWLYHIAAHPPAKGTLLFFGMALLFTCLLALLSVPRLAQLLTPKHLQMLRTLGTEYIALAFLVDFAQNPFDGSFVKLLAYLPFQILAAAGLLLRIVVYGLHRAHPRRLTI